LVVASNFKASIGQRGRDARIIFFSGGQLKTFITGGNGFVGSAVIRRLLAAGHVVRTLVRPGSNLRMLDGLPIERITGDLSNRSILHDAMIDCQWVFHVAALYAYWGYSWEEFYRSNVEGTRNVLEATAQTGVERIVYTSSIASLGIPSDGQAGNEETPVTLKDMLSDYKKSKFLAEKVVQELVTHGKQVIIVNPAAPVGVGDFKPTQTGKMIVDFLNGRMPAYVDTGLTIVDVDDVANGHLLAMEKGKVGERYILGGENLSLKQLMDLLSEISGRPRVWARIPPGVALAWAYLDTGFTRLNARHVPSATPAAVRVSSKIEYFSSKKASRDLGYTYIPAKDALRKAVDWYRNNGYVN
jgi:dihydroflavonol-4-reductase